MNGVMFGYQPASLFAAKAPTNSARQSSPQQDGFVQQVRFGLDDRDRFDLSDLFRFDHGPMAVVMHPMAGPIGDWTSVFEAVVPDMTGDRQNRILEGLWDELGNRHSS